MEESMVAACAARNGHSVLHIDINDFYGGEWAAFNFEGIQEWIKFHQNKDTAEDNIPSAEIDANKKETIESTAGEFDAHLNENESLHVYGFKNMDSYIFNVNQKWH